METTQIQQVAAYTRDYSPIESLQRAHSLRYLLEQCQGQLQIRVICTQAEQSTSVVCHLQGISVGFANGLLKFLYENAVPVEQIVEVLQDICGDLAVCED